ncbi:MAG: glycoprotein endo-alpha,2-mannosidase, partial [Gaiellaceae bacterium]|nr:glycoprotein endo-alpha,2-mannosidase [Gaiellaceae bacterium]
MRRPLLAIVLLLALPASGAHAAAPRTAIFFYPWYSNMRHDGHYAHWTQGGHQPPFDIASAFFPARGPYSSGDPRVLRAQMNDIAAAGVDEVVSSWWGRGSAEDDRLAAVLRAAKGRHLRVAVQLEPYPGRTIASIAADLVYVRSLGIRDVYIYRSNDFSADEWTEVTRQPM